MRLFVAIELPDEWRVVLRHYGERIEQTLPAGTDEALRRVGNAELHLTLRFLGEVDAGLLPDLEAALRARLPPVEARLALGGAGTFGSAARTSVVWAGVEGEREALAALAARADEAAVAAGLPAERRPWRPHLTIARVRRSVNAATRGAIAAAVASTPLLEDGEQAPGAHLVPEVVLVRSHLGSSGPRYEVIARI